MLPYAEEFLLKHQSNQWFIRFFADINDLNGFSDKQAHMEWFINQGLHLTQVRTHEFDLPITNFYHVSFAGDQDVRLKAYSDQFEDDQGVSLKPEIYQLYEWSYQTWVNEGLQQAWENAQIKSVD